MSASMFAMVLQLRALVIILIGFCGSGKSLACIEQERIGLMKLKAAIYFPSWHGNQSDCCRWEGVTCNNISMRVTKLLLQQTISSVVGWPSSLNASVFLPFEELEVLDLGHNILDAFTDTSGLKSLRVLNLQYNYLTQVPTFEGLKLEALDVSHNYFNLGDGNLSAIWSMASLKALSISGNQLNNSIVLPGMCRLMSLEELNASDNELVGSTPPCLHNMTSLYALDISGNHLTGNIPSSLFSSFESLVYIALSGNGFDGSFSLSAFINNSRLEVFDLTNNYHPLNIINENPLHGPSAQLKIFRLSDCILNEPHGVIPSFLLHQHDLRLLELSHNNMRGDFPSWLLENNTKLEVLRLINNTLSGSFSLNSSASENVYMRLIDVSSNLIEGELPVSLGSSFPNLAYLNMSQNLIRGGIPSSLGDMKLLSLLDLSSNKLVGELPQSLLSRCRNLETLKLSDNNLHGPVLPRTANLTNLYRLSLGNNQFTGEISPGLLNSPGLHILDISNNALLGVIPSWIGDLASLKDLMLSDNSLEGPLPLSFCKLTLSHLDLSSNNFGATISSCANISSLLHLSLEKNHLNGTFPQFLSDAKSIVTLDLRDNGFSGAVPPWIGSFSNLRVLLLKGNNFEGLIPHQLCHVTGISIMDLSSNNLSGPIPSCLNNSAFGNLMVPGAFTTLFALTRFTALRSYQFNSMVLFDITYDAESVYVDDLLIEVSFIAKRRLETYRGNILEYLSGLDLSSNQLSGSIPPEIGYLDDLFVLNFSNNHLTGPIPGTFSGLKQIESLDLSYNRLSGEIPPQLIELSFLSIFSVAHNNLSGRTPDRKNQFATFDERSYKGNIFLCGPPLESCVTLGQSPLSPPHAYIEESDEDDDSFRDAFLWSFAGSFVMAFLGTVAFLFLSSHYRILIFNFFHRHFHRIFNRRITCA